MQKLFGYGMWVRSPYSNGYGFVRSAGWIVRKLSTVEKGIDEYRDYYLTKAELVDRQRLSSSQRLLLQKDGHFDSGPLYMVTGCRNDLKKKEVKEREIFVNEEQLKSMGFKQLPTKDFSIGDGSKVVEKKRGIKRRFLFATLGQFWWNMRPRAQEVISGIGKSKDIETINDVLLNNPKQVNRSPIIGYVGRDKLKL